MVWFHKILRTFLSFLDKGVYSLISLFYELLMYLANLDLFGMSKISISDTTLTANNPILKFSNRIYALLGIFMLFRISFSILQYMINPDDFSDKGKGFGKLITNVLVSLVLIVTVPLIFQKAYEVQKVVLNENLLGKLILGVNDNGNNSKSTNKQMAEDLEFLVYASLMPVNEKAVSKCGDTPVLGTKAMASSENNCLDDLADALGDDSGELNKVFKTDDEGSNRDFGAFGTLLNATVDDEFVFDYYPVVTTIAGGFIAVMMVSFCLDVAVRIIKLAFLEIIAPIPVISYMDPSQSSKGGMLSKWAKECFSTFLSLFIRIAIIYFAFYLIDLVVSTCLADNGTAVYLNEDVPTGIMAILVQVLVIFGILYFTKEVPKLLESIFGIKGGNITLNPMKRLNESPLVSGVLGLGVGAGVGAITSGAAAFAASRETNEEGLGKNILRATSGALGGLQRGARAGMHGDLSGAGKRAAGLAGIAGRNAVLKSNTNFKDRMGAYLRQSVGMQSKKESLDIKASYYEKLKNGSDNMKKVAEGELSKKSQNWKATRAYEDRIKNMYNNNQMTISQYISEMDKIDHDKKTMIKSFIDGNGYIDGVADADSNYEIKELKKEYHRTIIENNLDYMKDTKGEYKKPEDYTWDDIKTSSGLAEEESFKIKHTDEYQNASDIKSMQDSGIMQQHFGGKH